MRRADRCWSRRYARVALLVCLVAAAWSPASAQVFERVLAVVDGRVITLLDVQAARALGLVRTSGSADPVQDALAQLIDRALILDEVDRYAPPEPDPAAVEQGLAEVRGRFETEAAFERALARTGMEAFAVRQWVRNDLRIQAYLEQRFAPVGDDLPVPGSAGPRAAGSGRAADEGDVSERERAARERREALVREWVDALRARARISRP